MKETTFNPYGFIGDNIGPGLDAIIAGLPPTGATVTQLVEEVYAFVSGLYYPAPSRQVEEQIKSIAYNAANSFRGNLVMSGQAGYNEVQAPFLEMLIGPSISNNYASQGFLGRVDDIQDNIGISELTVREQTPLYMATSVGIAAYEYWTANVVDPAIIILPGNPWNGYMGVSGAWPQNLNNIPFWSAGAMNGALAGYNAGEGSLDPITNVATAEAIGALAGALTVTAGMVTQKWVPRITKPLHLNSERIVNLTDITGQAAGIKILSIGRGCSEATGCRRVSERTQTCCPPDQAGGSKLICIN